jgi:hypothetical protein
VLAGSFHGTIDSGTGPLVASGYDGSGEGAEDVFLAILEGDLAGADPGRVGSAIPQG